MPSMSANPRLLVAFAAVQFVLFPIPIVTLFWKDQIGMSLTDVMLLQAVFSLAVVLFEFPSGYFADRVGYQRSLLVGTVLLMAGWLVYVVHGDDVRGPGDCLHHMQPGCLARVLTRPPAPPAPSWMTPP